MMNDNRSKYFVFVPFCLMAQAYQAQGIVKYEWKSSIRPFMDLLLDNNINIIQMPCAESTFNNSLVRKPKGINFYDTEEFNNHCKGLVDLVYNQIKLLIENDYKVLAILGIEQSPSCCVNYIYTNMGMQNRSGVFIEKLKDKTKDYNIPFIGINRKYIKKSYNELERILNNIN